jgi:DNA segregation ATPase FtsK/SpoIIIE-like protein
VDEADAFIPQNPLPGEQRMLGAMDKIVRRGRARGLGVTVVTQRPAVIHKNVLTQIEVLITLRLVSPQDRKAIEAWIEVHGTPEQRDTLMGSLASLPIGTAWISSPGWLNVFKKVKIRQRKTFDSSATPNIGENRHVPNNLAKVDLQRLKERIEATLGQSDSGNPKHLRQYIAQLENQLRETTATKTIENAQIERLENAIESLNKTGLQVVAISQELSAALTNALPQEQKRSLLEVNLGLTSDFKNQEVKALSEKKLSTPQLKILDALAAFERFGLGEIDRKNVAVFANQSPKSSGFLNNLSSLRRQGYINYPAKSNVALTIKGQKIAKLTTPIDSMAQLHAAWYSKLSNPQARIVKALVKHYPKAIDRATLAELTIQSAKSSGYLNNLSALRSLGIIDYPASGQVVATKLLFPTTKNQKSSIP